METKLIFLGYLSLGMLNGFLIGYGIRGLKLKKEPKNRTSKFPKCNCKDVNECSTWCHAKELFSKDYQDGII
ncbi:hypothetical protein OIU83_17690 [Flavobacterium sp. LS1R49]|uniref:Uncharacterized protein n=1 Tax=Flavobacterium shii TaxID=2987687 RepID=A0A9X2ZKR4_9FLAO|nr:hypothetical protein [Flavobacterium shii]MCV9929498.1 hypothetical protein [Flavobacterium shii]